MGEASEQASPQEDTGVFSIVQGVHNDLTRRFGAYKSPSWEPTTQSVRILPSAQFDDEGGLLIGKDSPKESVARRVAELVGYADFKGRSLFVRNDSDRGPQPLAQSIAHEELHLWFLRNVIEGIVSKRFSYPVNEAFIESLSLEGLGLFGSKSAKDEPELDMQVNNYLLIKVIMDKMGDSGWQSLVEACDGRDQIPIRDRFDTQFGKVPPVNLQRINEAYPTLHGKDFWGRTKDLAFILNTVSENPDYQDEHPEIHTLINLVLGWSKTRDTFEEYLKEVP